MFTAVNEYWKRLEGENLHSFNSTDLVSVSTAEKAEVEATAAAVLSWFLTFEIAVYWYLLFMASRPFGNIVSPSSLFVVVVVVVVDIDVVLCSRHVVNILKWVHL